MHPVTGQMELPDCLECLEPGQWFMTSSPHRRMEDQMWSRLHSKLLENTKCPIQKDIMSRINPQTLWTDIIHPAKVLHIRRLSDGCIKYYDDDDLVIDKSELKFTQNTPNGLSLQDISAAIARVKCFKGDSWHELLTKMRFSNSNPDCLEIVVDFDYGS
jgi:hypothetical protein